MKRFFLIFGFIFSCTVVQTQHLQPNSFQSNELIQKFQHLTSQELLDTADYFFYKNSADTALFCYNLLISMFSKHTNAEHQKRIVEALNRSAILYTEMGSFRVAYELLIKALEYCETSDYLEYKPRIYNNLGNIYCHFGIFDICRSYYLMALNLTSDSIILLNNLGYIEVEAGESDKALYFLNQSYQISKRQDDKHLHIVLNSIALLHNREKQYDSALHYFRLALAESKKNNHAESEAINLSKLGELFFKIKQYDSALYYIGRSNAIAEKSGYLKILAENYLTLSKIERSKGFDKKALTFFEKHVGLKDSILNTEKLGSIKQLQHLHEMSKSNRQIEQLIFDQQVKERTIHQQRIFNFITLVFLVLISAAFVIILLKNRDLNSAYKVLVEKNIEIIDLKKHTPSTKEDFSEKLKMNNDAQLTLLDKILVIMESTSIICDPEFTVNKLAELVNSNQKYVSEVINDILKKNFRSFLNSYRIREAQRLFSEPDAAKYTIEFVSISVGFKSQATFRNAFKEVTGVNPNFYWKSIQAV
jgi:tetratricopeptide (TPR) repeat protein